MLTDLNVDEVCALFVALKMEPHVSAVKKHNMDGLVLELLNSNDDLKEVDIVMPAPVGGAFVKRLNGFKASGVPLTLLGSTTNIVTVTAATTTMPGTNYV